MKTSKAWELFKQDMGERFAELVAATITKTMGTFEYSGHVKTRKLGTIENVRIIASGYNGQPMRFARIAATICVRTNGRTITYGG